MSEPAGLEKVAAAAVGVLGFTADDGSPRSCAVTPYVVDGVPTVTATLALLTKARMLRDRPSGALLAGGLHVSGDALVRAHGSPAWFDEHIRAAEREKYPPARQMLALPFHRHLLWWYVGRAEIAFPGAALIARAGDDRTTITSTTGTGVAIRPLIDLAIDTDTAEAGSDVEVGPAVPDGPACVLVHEETAGMAELLQLTLRGSVSSGVLHVESRHGTLEAQHPGTMAQLQSLRELGKKARANTGLIVELAEDPAAEVD